MIRVGNREFYDFVEVGNILKCAKSTVYKYIKSKGDKVKIFKSGGKQYLDQEGIISLMEEG